MVDMSWLPPPRKKFEKKKGMHFDATMCYAAAAILSGNPWYSAKRTNKMIRFTLDSYISSRSTTWMIVKKYSLALQETYSTTIYKFIWILTGLLFSFCGLFASSVSSSTTRLRRFDSWSSFLALRNSTLTSVRRRRKS